MASQKGHHEIVEHLLNEGVPLNHHSFNNYTILHIASQKNNLEVVKNLLRRDHKDLVNDNKNKWNHSPLTAATQYDGDLNMVKLLIENGADVTNKGDGKTALEWAKSEGKEEVVKYLTSIINTKK